MKSPTLLTTCASLLGLAPLAACTDALDPDLGSVEQAVTPSMQCGVFPNPNGAPDTEGSCVAADPANVSQINFAVAASNIPINYRTYVWTITTNAHGGPSIIDGCTGSTNYCVLRVNPSCMNRYFDVKATVRDVRSITVPAETPSAVATVPSSGCTIACTAPPATPPQPAIAMRCQGRFGVSWPAVANVNRYTLIANPSGFSWTGSSVYTVFDTNGTSCNTRVAGTTPPWPTLLRLRMCNDCGCSDWGPTSSVVYDPHHECDV